MATLTMNLPPRSTRAGALALLLALPSTARAQGVARDAQAAFQRGVADVDAHRFASALEAFEASYALHPSLVALYDMALVHREMGHVQRAIEVFERYLTEGGARLDAARVASVRDALTQLRAQCATVALSVTPPSFTASVDGRELALTDGALTLDPGDHVLVVASPGRRPWREALHLGAGERVARALTLEPDAPPPAADVPAPAPVASLPAAQAERAVTPHPRDAAASPSIATRWWFWTGLGALVVGGVIAGVAVATSDGAAPLPGTAFDVQTIRAR
jgi:tetratricopeptide (TPR) repeat protein